MGDMFNLNLSMFDLDYIYFVYIYKSKCMLQLHFYVKLTTHLVMVKSYHEKLA